MWQCGHGAVRLLRGSSAPKEFVLVFFLCELVHLALLCTEEEQKGKRNSYRCIHNIIRFSTKIGLISDT
jgi:hypothetical protein